MNDTRGLELHRDLLTRVLPPKLKAVDETAALEPVKDTRGRELHRDLLP